MPVTSHNPHPLPKFDEFRTNIQKALTYFDGVIQNLKANADSSDSAVKVYLYLYQGLFSIIEGEKKYRSGEYGEAYSNFIEGDKMIKRFQRMSSRFSKEFQQLAERLSLFSKGRHFECAALKKGTKIEEQLANLKKAVKSYVDEIALVETIKDFIMLYNVKARANFVTGLVLSLEGHSAIKNSNLQLAKEKHLEGYRYFTLASYYNPAYQIWVTEQNNALRTTMNLLIKDKAAKVWGQAYAYSNEGKFIESSESCNIASKLYKRASKIALDKKSAMMMSGYHYMLRASMFEAKANNLIKNKNDAKGSIRQFELAADAMKKAVDALPKMEGKQDIQSRWSAQWSYYQGNYYQSQGIFNLDSEKYPDALKLFNQADKEFQKAMKEAEQTKDAGLKKLLKKSIAEAKGYIGMCRTVID